MGTHKRSEKSDHSQEELWFARSLHRARHPALHHRAKPMIHLEPGHRIVAETVAARIHSAPDKREAVDVRCSDFGAQYYVSVQPDEKHMVRVSLWLRCFDEVMEAVGDRWFQEFYPGMVETPPQAGYKLTLAINLDSLPADSEGRGAKFRNSIW